MKLYSLVVLSSSIASSVLGAQTVPIYSYTVPAPTATTGYAPNGNLLSYSDSINGDWSMTYDALGRLKLASATTGAYQSLGLSMTYDSFGNRKAQTPSGSPPFGTVPDAWALYDSHNRITASNSAPPGVMQYDAAGNVIADGRVQAAYDAEGSVCATFNTVLGGAVTQYLYDAEGRRVAKGHSASNSSQLVCSAGGADFLPAETYVVGQSGEQISQLDGAGNWQHTNVYAAGQLLATYDSHGTGLHFHVNDPLGSRRLQVDSAGHVENTFANLPFGDGLYVSGSGVDATAHHFTGKERDTESGLDNFGTRYYASSMGRFMSPDPSGLYFADATNPQSLNLYSYALNNPLKLVDPSGLTPCNYGSSDQGGEDYEDADNDKECTDNGGKPIDYSETVNVNANGSGDFSLSTVEGGNSTLIQTGQFAAPPTSKTKAAICGAIPSGRTVGASGGVGGLGAVVGGGEVVFNYNSGQVSAFGYGGVQLGWNGGLSGSLYGGAVYGLNDSNTNYSGGFTGVNGGAEGVGFFAASSSGGLTGGASGLAVHPFAAGSTTAIGGGAGYGLLSGASGGVNATNYSNPAQLGQFTGFTLADYALYAARGLCK